MLIYCKYGVTKENDKYVPDPTGCQRQIQLGKSSKSGLLNLWQPVIQDHLTFSLFAFVCFLSLFLQRGNSLHPVFVGSRGSHEDTCEFKIVTCPNEKCQATCRSCELEEHRKVCNHNTCSHQDKGAYNCSAFCLLSQNTKNVPLMESAVLYGPSRTVPSEVYTLFNISS